MKQITRNLKAGTRLLDARASEVEAALEARHAHRVMSVAGFVIRVMGHEHASSGDLGLDKLADQVRLTLPVAWLQALMPSHSDVRALVKRVLPAAGVPLDVARSALEAWDWALVHSPRFGGPPGAPEAEQEEFRARLVRVRDYLAGQGLTPASDDALARQVLVATIYHTPGTQLEIPFLLGRTQAGTLCVRTYVEAGAP
ncbi:hypothetical protein [Chondromyces apiculatus]|uniref:hypothetical protein n=1 Tax=Chondromyces apiculatus TaxID=51 RepID=UPI0012DC0E33|nr:hypothetical protein [Chondromyces apiculatus]